nr:hypothetical protein [Tanacetum cinerariifolium]
LVELAKSEATTEHAGQYTRAAYDQVESRVSHRDCSDRTSRLRGNPPASVIPSGYAATELHARGD